MGMDFMLYFNLFICAYLLYYGIKGQGKIYENDYPDEIKESHAKLLRKFCLITGIGLCPLTIVELMFSSQNQDPNLVGSSSGWFSWVSIGFVAVCVVVYLIIFKVRFGEALKDPRKRKRG